MSAEMLVICPKCAEPSLKRLMSSGMGLVFKGSGFYLTDYKKSNSAPSLSSAKSESKTESKPETKPESKPDSKPSMDSSSGTDKK
jgi:predicted nucleic acid-binding Zn ribbon protein